MAIRVLIADDHDGARAGIADVIRRCGEDWCVCGEAADGHSAVKIALECKPDVIILDVRMPYLDGVQAAYRIRAHLPGVPIFFYTLLATPALEAAARAGGFQGVVPKPDSRNLIAAIRKALPSTRPGNAAI